MRILQIFMIAFGCAAQARALSSVEPWLFSCLPYETTPFKEMNLTYAAGLARQVVGTPYIADQMFQAQAGIWDCLALTVESGLAVRSYGNRGYLERGLLQARLLQSGRLPLDIGLLGGWMREPYLGGDAQACGGLVLAREIMDQSVCANAFLFGQGNPLYRAAFRTSFLVPLVRLGVEGEWQGQDASWAPQASLDLPGDLNLKGGVKLSCSQPGMWLAGFQLSMEFFGGI